MIIFSSSCYETASLAMVEYHSLLKVSTAFVVLFVCLFVSSNLSRVANNFLPVTEHDAQRLQSPRTKEFSLSFLGIYPWKSLKDF